MQFCRYFIAMLLAIVLLMPVASAEVARATPPTHYKVVVRMFKPGVKTPVFESDSVTLSGKVTPMLMDRTCDHDKPLPDPSVCAKPGTDSSGFYVLILPTRVSASGKISVAYKVGTSSVAALKSFDGVSMTIPGISRVKCEASVVATSGALISSTCGGKTLVLTVTEQ